MSDRKRPLEKAKVLRILDSMKATVERLPNSVKYQRFFLADDGAGIILTSGIEDAAETLGKKGKEELWTGGLSFRFVADDKSDLTIYQLNTRN